MNGNAPDLLGLSRQFDAVSGLIGESLAAKSSHLVALVAKWKKSDLVPGLSDLDFRAVCDDQTTAEDWVEIDCHLGQIHLDMVRAHPEWNRINEHTPGAGLTVGELMDERFYNPEYAVWDLWWGEVSWFSELKERVSSRPFGAIDEHYHLSRFLAYYSPYIHGIDPPINLGSFEPKYPLHSRCWHYFAPPMLSAASILARRNLSGKRIALEWLREHGYVVEQAEAVLYQVDRHYDTPELADEARLRKFEELLFSGFEELLELLHASVRDLDLMLPTSPDSMKKELGSIATAPLADLMEIVRFARIRAGRYYFYVNAPDHFDTGQLFIWELNWIRKLSQGVFSCVANILGNDNLSPEECLARLDIRVVGATNEAVQHVMALSRRSADDRSLGELFGGAIELFPHYYRILETTLARVSTRLKAPKVDL